MSYLTTCTLGLNRIALLFFNDIVCSCRVIVMVIGDKAPAPFFARHILRRLLFLYAAFIVYGSLIPFFFNFDPVFLKWRLGLFLTESLGRGLRHFSIADVICNILLFAVFGLLGVTAYPGSRMSSAMRAVLRVGAVGLLFGFAIELAQTTSPYRDASMLDVLSNVVGAILGASLGRLVLRGYRGPLGIRLVRIARENPWGILFVFLVLAPLAGTLFPFQFSLNIGTAWAKLRPSLFSPFSGGFHEPWLDLLADKLLLFAAIGFVLERIPNRHGSLGTAVKAGLIGSALAMFFEIAKLFVIWRTFDIQNLVLGSTGALFGALAISRLACVKIVKRHSKEILLLLAIGLISYSELTPLDWIHANELPTKIASIEWLPFKTYFFTDPLLAVFDMLKKLYVSIPLGSILAARIPPRKPRLYRATVLASLVAVALEASQVALRSRTPSVTDVLLLGFGTWLGAVAFDLPSRTIGFSDRSLTTS